MNQQSQSTTSSTKGKAVEKKELGHMTRLYMPRGSQSLSVGHITAESAKFVHGACRLQKSVARISA